MENFSVKPRSSMRKGRMRTPTLIRCSDWQGTGLQLVEAKCRLELGRRGPEGAAETLLDPGQPATHGGAGDAEGGGGRGNVAGGGEVRTQGSLCGGAPVAVG